MMYDDYDYHDNDDDVDDHRNWLIEFHFQIDSLQKKNPCWLICEIQKILYLFKYTD